MSHASYQIFDLKGADRSTKYIYYGIIIIALGLLGLFIYNNFFKTSKRCNSGCNGDGNVASTPQLTDSITDEGFSNATSSDEGIGTVSNTTGMDERQESIGTAQSMANLDTDEVSDVSDDEIDEGLFD